MRPGETIEAPNMGMRVTCRQSAASSGGELLSFEFWMRSGATPPPMHAHPHQEERITVVSGSVRSRSGAAHRVLSPGDTVVSPPGESHTVGPAGNEDVEMLAELRPALAYEQFIERSFALDRAGHVNAKGRGNPPAAGDRETTRGRVLPAPHPNRAAESPAPRIGLARPTAPHSPRLTKAAAQPRVLLLDDLDRVGQLVERPSGRSNGGEEEVFDGVPAPRALDESQAFWSGARPAPPIRAMR
jgi:mannose-6-phosphate isomerase-like protein (cupin superfamily)